MDAKKTIRLTAAQKAALKAAFVPYCPHHLLQTKVSCTPENCTIANKFVDEVRTALMQ